MSGSQASIREKFTEDHRRLEGLLDQVVAALEADDRDEIVRLWSELDAGLSAHLDAEEKHCIPALLAAHPKAGMELLAEHKAIRARLTELGTEVDLGTVRLEPALAFIDELRAHAEREDDLLYRWADENLEAADRTVLLRALVDLLRSKLRRHPTARLSP